MRKFLSLFLAFAIVLTPVFSLAADYTSLSDDDLLNELDQIRAEIAKRTINPDKILCDSDGLTISLKDDAFETKETSVFGTTLYINCIAVNNSNETIGVIIEKIALNGWECEVHDTTTLDAGKKSMVTFDIMDILSKVDFTSVSEIEDIEFYYKTYSPVTYKTITDNLRKKVVLK